MDRFEAMSILLEVADAGSLSAAGRRLGMPLSSVSRKIADLEAHLKTRLLTRSSRKLALTDAGQAYLAACKRIIEQVGEAERAAAGEYRAPRGDLVITAPIAFGRLHILPVVLEFLAAFPEIDIRLFLADRLIDLLEEHIDVALRIGPLADSSMIAQRVGSIRRVVCASPDYLARRGRPLRPQDLLDHECIDSVGARAPSRWSFGAGKTAIEVQVHSRLTVNTAEAAIDSAIAGAGITRVLSYQVAAAVRDARLDIILAEFETAPWPVSLVHAGQGLVPQKLRAFLDFASPRMRERLAHIP